MTGFMPSVTMCVAPQIGREGKHRSWDERGSRSVTVATADGLFFYQQHSVCIALTLAACYILLHLACYTTSPGGMWATYLKNNNFCALTQYSEYQLSSCLCTLLHAPWPYGKAQSFSVGWSWSVTVRRDRLPTPSNCRSLIEIVTSLFATKCMSMPFQFLGFDFGSAGQGWGLTSMSDPWSHPFGSVGGLRYPNDGSHCLAPNRHVSKSLACYMQWHLSFQQTCNIALQLEEQMLPWAMCTKKTCVYLNALRGVCIEATLVQSSDVD